MKKTKQTKNTASAIAAPKIKMTNNIKDLVSSQSSVIESVLSGSVRIRAERWHGNTSVFDTHRILNFLNDCHSTGMINLAKYNTLAKAIPTFFKAIGPNLVRAINAASKSTNA
jgi:hypothetical protein